MKKTNLISLSSYCKTATVWDKNDMIKHFVQIEDTLNHKYEPIVIPKNMKYPKMRFKPASTFAFLNAILP